MRKKRVISLLPGATEIVCALGAAEQLVGRSHECDYPPAVLALPACTAPKLVPGATSAEIDRQFRTVLPAGESFYRIDARRVQELQPDLILTQGQCPVCAVSLSEVEDLVGKFPGSRPQVLALAPTRMVNIWEAMLQVAEALEMTETGREVVRPLKRRVVDIIEKACVMAVRPAVACLEWIEPLMAAGNWVPELVELAGGQNQFGEPGKLSPPLAWETLRASDPDIIVVMPCGFDLRRTRAEMGSLTNRAGWNKLRAVRKGRVYLTDGSHFFNRPGPRIVESLEVMAELCHPDRFNYGHRGRAWEKL